MQIARFDPSKSIPDILESYRILCGKLQKENRQIPQLVICGNGSVDDPDGEPILAMTMDIVHSPRFAHLKDHIKVARLPHMDQLLNTLMRRSKIVLQLSHKEGYEVKVTEALMVGKPVVAFSAGGIPLQIRDKENGFLVKLGDREKVAEYLYLLLEDEKLYAKMSKKSASDYPKEALLIPNAINWLYLACTLLQKGEVKGNGKEVQELIARFPL